MDFCPALHIKKFLRYIVQDSKQATLGCAQARGVNMAEFEDALLSRGCLFRNNWEDWTAFPKHAS